VEGIMLDDICDVMTVKNYRSIGKGSGPTSGLGTGIAYRLHAYPMQNMKTLGIVLIGL
jgi:hypothetical protein